MHINNNKLFVGMDLHKNTSSFCVKDYAGTILRQEKILTDKNQIRDFMLSLGSTASIVLEPVSQWYTYADMLEQLGHDVHLAHPMKVKAIASARIKTDKIDASVLADLLRSNLLPALNYKTPFLHIKPKAQYLKKWYNIKRHRR